MESNQDISAANRFAEALQKKYPPEVAIGVGIIIPNFVNGCSWGFVPDTNTEYAKYLSAITSNVQMSSIKIKGGYIVTMNMNYLLSILKDVASGYLTMKDLEYANQHRTDALKKLQKFMTTGQSGKIGIYNLNDSDSITVSGVRFKAFCVTMPDLITLCARNGYGFFLGGKMRTPNQVSAHMMQVVEKLELAPSSNAMFIEVRKM